MNPDAPAPRREAGDILVDLGRLTERQLELVRHRQRRLSTSQHRAIVDLGYASEEEAARALAQAQGLDFVDLAGREFSREELEVVPLKVVLHFRTLPLGTDAEAIVLAFGDPPRQADLNNLRMLLNRRVKVVLTTPSAIQAVIKSRFGLGAETVERLRGDRTTDDDASPDVVFDVPTVPSDAAVEATIADFVDQVVGDAIRQRATDIHLEPYYSAIRLRYRVDGVLQPIPVPPGLRDLHAAIVSRLKIMAGLNIAERRLPQDGRISLKTETEDYDLRVSVIPTKHGEAICLRVLGRHSLLLELSQLGMDPGQEAIMRELTGLPQGLVLLTGPTGSGKTTTLYAALAHANDEGRKIITIEDPVEYQLEGVSQIQVHDDIGLSFSQGLRSVLRHDPDVVLIGEIRDAETAEIAVRASLTGHLVLSTLHTNDSISSVARLLEMRVEPFLVASSLVCSIAQRLAQHLCPHCRQPDPDLPEPTRTEMAAALDLAPEQVCTFIAPGCPQCGQRGYRGRLAIYEFFPISDTIADLIVPAVKTGTLRQAARAEGWRSLREMGWIKVQEGSIAVSEQRRLTHRLRRTTTV
ncbi:MAG: type II/IV secretion system protein [Verrucomicrobiales bacterium]|nr:type II/IV secretion system protein [Verrucomicrobiales bacterium]